MKNSNKANLAVLNELHARVAETLMENLDDPKILASAIKFLKDNDITADLIEEDQISTLGKTIKEKLKVLEDKPMDVTSLLEVTL